MRSSPELMLSVKVGSAELSAGVPPPLMFEFDKVFLCLAKFGVKLQKYWRVDPVPGKINFTHFLT